MFQPKKKQPSKPKPEIKNEQAIISHKKSQNVTAPYWILLKQSYYKKVEYGRMK